MFQVGRVLVLMVAGLFAADLHAGVLPTLPGPLPTPDLGLRSVGIVNAVERLANGGYLIAGSFDLVNGQPRGGVVKLNADGSLDPGWTAPILDQGDFVYAIDSDAAGAAYIAGTFDRVNGQLRAGLAKLGPDGALDPTFNPTRTGPLARSLRLHGSHVYVVGGFTAIGGQPLARVARLSLIDGSADPTFAPNVSGGDVIAIDLDGTNVYLCGAFTTIGVTTRNRLAKLTSAGALVTTWNPNPNGQIEDCDLDGTNLYVVGDFSVVASTARMRIAKVRTDTGFVDPAFNASAGSSFSAIPRKVLRAGSHVYISGNFASAGGQPRAGLARFLETTGALDAWNPAADNNTESIDATGLTGMPLIAGGRFSRFGMTDVTAVAVINDAGSADPSFSTRVMTPAQVLTIVREPTTGAFFVGGTFLEAGPGIERRRLLKLDANGELDPSWQPLADGNVLTLALGNDGFVYAGGDFTRIGSTPRRFAAKLAPGGAGNVDPTWNPDPDGAVSVIAAVDTDLLVGGLFGNIGGASRISLARVASTGVGIAVPAFNAVLNDSVERDVHSIAFDSDGTVFIAGRFATVAGQTRHQLAKLTQSTGALVPSFDALVNAGGPAFGLVVHDTSLYVGRRTTGLTFNGVAVQLVTRLSKTTGVRDAGFQINQVSGSGIPVVPLMVDVDDALYIGGTLLCSTGGFCITRIPNVATSGGAIDIEWIPTPANLEFMLINTAVFDPVRRRVLFGGTLTNLSGMQRLALAAVPEFERVFRDGFEGP